MDLMCYVYQGQPVELFLELEEYQSRTDHGKRGHNCQSLGIRYSTIVMVFVVTS